MIKDERTRDLYEDTGNYPKPEIISLPEQHDFHSLEDIGVTITTFSKFILKLTSFLTGFSKFRKQFPLHIEHYLKTVNIRGPALFAPVVSASLVLEDDKKKRNPVERATSLILGTLDLYNEIYDGKFSPDKIGNYFAEMGQYPNFFGTSVIIEDGKPRLFKSKHKNTVSIICNKRFYTIDLRTLDSNDSFNSLKYTIDEIVTDALKTENKNPSIGLLTAAADATQLQAFPKHIDDPANKLLVETMAHSLFTVCLDFESRPTDYSEVLRLTHLSDPSNRWYHSSLQLVVFANSKAGAICNFNCYLDGNTMIRGVSEIQKRALNYASGKKAETQKLLWRFLPNKINKPAVDQVLKDLQLIKIEAPVTFQINGYGRSFFKTYNLDPVLSFVIILQAALSHVLGFNPSIIQFLSAARYRYMDLLTANVSTPEVVNCAESLNNMEIKKEIFSEELENALRTQKLVMAKKRSSLPLDHMYAYYVHSLGSFKRHFVNYTVVAALWFLRAFGLHKRRAREVIISHPAIYDNIPVMGRPGVRLFYINHFSMHYQILENKIVMTYMPGKDWKINNKAFTDILLTKLIRFNELLSSNVK